MSNINCKYSGQRNLYLDIIKGIAILLVIVGHCIQYGSGNIYYTNELYFTNPIFIFIYSFHMPIFMMVSGYLFYYSINKHTTLELIKSRITKLLIPIFAWTTAFQIIIYVVKILKRKNIVFEHIPIDILKTGLGNLWFLWAIFYCSMAVIIVQRYFKDKIWVYCLIGIILIIIPDKLNACLYKFMYPYFVVAYFWNKEKLWNNIQCKIKLKVRIVFYIVLFITFAFLLSRFNYNSYVYTSQISILNKNIGNQLLIDTYRWAIGFIGSACILIGIKFVMSFTVVRKAFWILIDEFGKKSLGIYVVSNYIFTYVLLKITTTFQLNYILMFLEVIIVIGISYIITILIDKNKFMRKVFLGGR